ncbi:MAG TPA: hypothetical protein PLO59_05935, partial [Bacteroidia bacterium]|nr:hypothetical protein [Bacteroidia bacterium]
NDALVILSLIKELQPSTYKILKQALNHTAMPVQFEAVKLSQRLHAHELLADISQVAATTQSIALKQRCITAIYALSRNNITQLSWHKEQQWQIASLKGMLGNELLQHEAHKQLHVLFTQGKQSLIAALTIVQQSGNTHFSNEVMEALQSTDEEILALAINAAGVCHRAEIVHKLISLSEQTKYTASVMKSLSMQGGAAVKLIAEAISSKTLSLPTQKKLIAVIAKANHTYSVPVLTTLANERTPLLHDIVFSLYVLGYKSAQTDKQFLQIIDNKFLFASMLISQIQQVAMQQNKLLHNALTIELNDVRSQLLYMFTFFYNTENILRVKHAYVIDKPNVIANAMEVIDVTLNKSHAQKFIALFDNVSIETKLNEMQKYFHVQLQPQTVIKQILNAPEDTFNSWTKAVAVYTLSKDQTTHYNLRLKQIMTHADRLLQQTIVHKLQAIAH